MNKNFNEFKVIRISESGCSAIIFGSATLPLKKIENTLNKAAEEGWQVVFQIVETKRTAFLWTRESLVVTLGR